MLGFDAFPKPKLFQQDQRPMVAIIIDDLGHRWDNSLRSLRLPGEVTLAILPFSPYAQKLAEQAHTAQKEVILHAPMEPISHHSWDGGIDRDMDERSVRDSLAQMLAGLPNARGVNNHMGSAVTPELELMNWVMEELAGRDLYFVDSRTSVNSRAIEAAQAQSVPNIKRDVFLDNNREPSAIAAQLRKLIAIAKKRGSAVGIGHPYPETLQVLEELLPNLAEEGIRLAPVSQLIERQIPNIAKYDRPSQIEINIPPQNAKSI